MPPTNHEDHPSFARECQRRDGDGGKPHGTDNPLSVSRSSARRDDWDRAADAIEARGQAPRKQAGHTTAPTECRALLTIPLAIQGPSTHDIDRMIV
jgi:hypothetical protein